MEFIGILMLGGAIVSPGIDAATSSQNISDQIDGVVSQTQKYKDAFNSVITNEMKLDDKIKTDITNMIDERGKLLAGINMEREKFQVKTKTIQLFGVIFITYIFFLLLMKQFGIKDIIKNVFSAPFRK